MNENSNSVAGPILLAFAGGAMVGVGLALLFAPQSGRATRRKIGAMAEDAEEGAEELFRETMQGLKDARQKGGDWIDQVKDYVSSKKSELESPHDGSRP
jgi:gas vesicle protein